MDETRKGLGAFEAKMLSDLAAEGKTVFSISELAKKTCSQVKARKMAATLVKKKWLKRLKRGVYLTLELAAGSTPQWTQDSYYIASKLVSPFYIGYFNALHVYVWTGQIPFSVFIATTKKARSRIIDGVSYKIVTINKKKFFGIIERPVANDYLFDAREILVSNPMKTLADALDHPEYCGGIQEVAKAIYNASTSHGDPDTDLDWNKLIEYAERMGNGAILKRLGYIIELMEISIPNTVMSVLKSKLTSGYAPLSPGVKSSGKHNSKWRLILNTPLSKQLVLA